MARMPGVRCTITNEDAKPMQLMEMEERLIGFDTTSVNSNLEMVDFLESYLKGLGMQVLVDTSPDGRKANLLATLGAPDTGGLMLAGHMDVVPVAGQAWDGDPFVLRPSDGKYYGRGTADMKSFIAQAIQSVEAIRHRKLTLPVHLAFTYDEEVGCHGARHLMDELQRRDHVMPKCAVIGEPTNFKVFRLHKGFSSARVTVTGVEGHSSKPAKGANAIYQAALVIQKLMEVEEERKGRRGMEDLFEIPHTTLSVGMIEGGTALNIIPNHCEVKFEYRTMPGEDTAYVLNQIKGYVSEVLLPAFKKQHQQVDIQVEETGRGEPMITAQGSEIELLDLELTGVARSGAAPFYTEGAIYNEAGIPTVICGPGDIDQAHRPNEFITEEQLQKGLPLIGRLIERVCMS
ncbi:MAG: acetylornithine deacetylase [SAR324 cluster bacterium]|nr:acetylornithine deacetylase [SAR324 cluster bacterium]